MNWDIVEGKWKQFKGTVKARWGKLTDDHLVSLPENLSACWENYRKLTAGIELTRKVNKA